MIGKVPFFEHAWRFLVQLVFDIHDTVSQIGMRALAPRSQQAGGREWQWRMPRGNLSSLC